jgi:hypothetical protein
MLLQAGSLSKGVADRVQPPEFGGGRVENAALPLDAAAAHPAA